MDWIPNTIAELGKIIAPLGLNGLVILCAAGLIGWAVWWNRRNGTKTATEVAAEIIQPVTCHYAEKDRYDIGHMANQIDEIRTEVIKISARQGRNGDN